MYGYVSFAQLAQQIRRQLHLLPADVDLVVGVPRSGMPPAYMIGLYLNRLVTDIETFVADGAPGHGSTREIGARPACLQDARHVLLVDDSIASGESMRRALQRIHASSFAGRVTTCAAIVTPSQHASVDVSFISMPLPRIFEWNAFHHACVEQSCFDLDGVLCLDPTDYDNDDGARYRDFLQTARVLFLPSVRIGHIVSARLEKYRGLTERWLAAHGVRYGHLHLLDLPSRQERMRLGAHFAHKIRVYKETGAPLFYESDPAQAREIALGAGKPVFCVDDMQMILPGTANVSAAVKTAAWRLRRPLGRARGWLKQQLRGKRSTLAGSRAGS